MHVFKRCGSWITDGRGPDFGGTGQHYNISDHFQRRYVFTVFGRSNSTNVTRVSTVLRKKDINKLDRIKRKATKLIPELRNFYNESR